MISTLYRGSVKDLLGPARIETPGGAEPCIIFQYSDSYSVFDWGRMPDALPGKGAALAVIAMDLFERLERPAVWQEFSRSQTALALRRSIAQIPITSLPQPSRTPATEKQVAVGTAFNELGEKLQKEGLRTHLLGALTGLEQLKTLRLADLNEPGSWMAVKPVQVVRPILRTVMGREVLDYAPTREAPAPRLIPVEVIFRFGAPDGSSLLERVAKNPQYLAGLGAPEELARQKLKAGSKWEFPLVELTTKLETSDRYVGFTEAVAMAGISALQLQEILLKTMWVAGYLKEHLNTLGIELWDGKLEWALDENGECFLVDAIGPDELRILKDGVQLSKQFMRDFYRRTPWYDKVNSAKRRASEQGVSDWKRGVGEEPPRLSRETFELGQQLYLSLANVITGRRWFPEAWPLEKVAEGIRRGSS